MYIYIYIFIIGCISIRRQKNISHLSSLFILLIFELVCCYGLNDKKLKSNNKYLIKINCKSWTS